MLASQVWIIFIGYRINAFVDIFLCNTPLLQIAFCITGATLVVDVHPFGLPSAVMESSCYCNDEGLFRFQFDRRIIFIIKVGIYAAEDPHTHPVVASMRKPGIVHESRIKRRRSIGIMASAE